MASNLGIVQNIPLVDLQGQYEKIKVEVDAAIAEVVQSCKFINGPAVKNFTTNLAQYLNVKHVIPCANGTDALQIALMALELSPGDEVITTPFTFVATAEVIELLQLKPVFVDANPCTFMLNEYLLEQAITDRTKAIIPVHLFGQSCNMEAIMTIAEKHDIAVIEDNAQSIGAAYYYSDGTSQKLGCIGHIGTTSFFPAKNLGAYGDGGAIFTDDDELAVQLRMIANHGSKIKYYHTEVGVNSRLDSIQAAVLDVKLKYLNQYNQARQAAAKYYDEGLADLHRIVVPKKARYSDHVYHQYTLLVEYGRDELKQKLQEAGVASGVYYPVPLHLQAAYQRNNAYKEGMFPIAEALAKKVLSLPMHTELTQDQQDYIINIIKTHY